MSEGAMSREALLAGLQDITLPIDAPGGLVAEIAATVGLAGLASLILGGVVWLLSQRRMPVRAATLKDKLDAIEMLPEDSRRLALLHLLRDHAPERYDAVSDGLYRPGGGPDLAALEQEAGQLV